MYPETCINHAGDEQMKSMIPETSSGINWRDHVRDVSSNWHQHIHPSRAGVQDSFLLRLPLTPGIHSRILFPYPTHHGSLLLSWKGKIVSSPSPALARESFYSSASTLFLCAVSLSRLSFHFLLSGSLLHWGPSIYFHLHLHPMSYRNTLSSNWVYVPSRAQRLSGGGVHRQE